MSENWAIHPVATLCRVLGVSPSGYYAWSKRTLSRRAKDDAVLIERLRTIHAASKGTYGAPRIHAELEQEGSRVSKKRIARLMREAGLAGVSRRRFVKTTVRDSARQAPDLVDRDFTAERPNIDDWREQKRPAELLPWRRRVPPCHPIQSRSPKPTAY